MRNILSLCLFTAAFLGGLAVSPAHAKPSDKDIQKVIKTLVTAIRYDKDDLAAKQIAWEPMAKAIMDDNWKDLNADQQKEVIKGVETLIRRISFVKGRDMFKHLDTIIYSPVTMKGKEAIARATVVVHRNYKKTEVVIDFVLVEDGGAWKIKDTIMAGESTAAAIHEDQVEVLMDKGGVPALMKALREKVAEVS